MKNSGLVVSSIFSAAVLFLESAARAQTNQPVPPEKDAPPHKTFTPMSERIVTNDILLEFVGANGGESSTNRPALLAIYTPQDDIGSEDFCFLKADALFCSDMKVIKLTSEDWTGLEANHLTGDLAEDGNDPKRPRFHPDVGVQPIYGFQVGHDAFRLQRSNDDDTAVYGFQSRSGVTGILQISRMTNSGPGLRIRYKVVLNGDDPAF